MYSGRAGLFSMFLRRALIYVRKYSASSQYSLPPERPQDPGMGERDILVLYQKGQSFEPHGRKMDFRSGFAQNPVFQLEFQIARSQYGRLRADPLPVRRSTARILATNSRRWNGLVT
jgi:hypothetical protein